MESVLILGVTIKITVIINPWRFFVIFTVTAAALDNYLMKARELQQLLIKPAAIKSIVTIKIL